MNLASASLLFFILQMAIGMVAIVDKQAGFSEGYKLGYEAAQK